MLQFSSAYRQLDSYEREFVDGFLVRVDKEAEHRHERLTATLERVSRSIDLARLDDRTRDLFNKPLVAAAIRERVEEFAQQRDLTPEWIIKQYRNIAGASLENYFTVGQDGFPQIDLSALTTEQWSALQEVDCVEEYSKRGNIRRVKVKLQPKMEALAKLMAHTGMDKADNSVHSTYKSPSVPVLTDGQSVSELAESYARFIDG